ncbi:MAG: Flagellar P-ring protein precursor [Planctomycetes bacterium ADurb.Bin401]|nr:MAG: Flagellar P-ring protein precursor [Planctomycetes bacterium ADurb.Bin401]
MKTRKVSAVTIIGLLLICVPFSQAAAKKKIKDKKTNATPESVQLDRTVGDLAEIVALRPISVKGIGLVVGLSGTGSSECPPATREYLQKYILTQVGRKDLINPDTMINSIDTAVVSVEGVIPAAASKYQSFDITVKALPGTQTTSLAGGRLYTTDLKFVTRVEETMESSRTLAYAAGPIYIDNLKDSKTSATTGIVLGGGKVIEDHQITLALFKPDFKAAAYIRNRINQRFGKDVANAVSESVINVTVPPFYKNKKARFIRLVRSLYIASLEEQRINNLVEELRDSTDKAKAQIALEAIGKPTIDKLLPLLESEDVNTKFAAGTNLIAIGDDRALKMMRDFAQNPDSVHRMQAIINVGEFASKNNTVALMNRLVNDENFDVRYTAYSYLCSNNDPSIIRTVISDDFFIDQVISAGQKIIYTSRKQQPGIVLFGAPVDCEKGIYIESQDGNIIINSEPADERVSILRKHPVTGGLMGPLKCSTRVADIIKLLGDPPSPKDDKKRPGLGVPYSEIVVMLKNMVDKGAVNASFVLGPIE